VVLEFGGASVLRRLLMDSSVESEFAGGGGGGGGGFCWPVEPCCGPLPFAPIELA